ncbi:MAG: hypothetical protein UZ01_01790 [Candidatus Brocadia sinica]|nr:MAG: hypothetical protein UZ01_01790 [Candidatus Brocadia sinica]
MNLKQLQNEFTETVLMKPVFVKTENGEKRFLRSNTIKGV